MEIQMRACVLFGALVCREHKEDDEWEMRPSDLLFRMISLHDDC